MLAGLLRRMAAVLAAVVLLPTAPAVASGGLSRNMLAAEAAVGREEYEVAAQYFEAECTAGGALGCYNLAIYEHIGKIAPSNPAKAIALNQRACDLGSADGCANLAVQTLEETGDATHAARLSASACKQNAATGCFTLALIHAGKYGGSVKPRKAAQFLEKACRLGHGPACYRRGFDIARQARDGIQWQRVSDLYLAACDAGSADGCNGLGALAGEGRGGKPDGATAKTYFSLGCDRGSATACRNLGDLLREGKLVPGNEAASQQAYRRADQLSRPIPVTIHTGELIP